MTNTCCLLTVVSIAPLLLNTSIGTKADIDIIKFIDANNCYYS